MIGLGLGCQQPASSRPPPPEGQDSGLVDPTTPCAHRWYPDLDTDGYGAAMGAVVACAAPPLHRRRAGDCDDGDPRIHPGADELCNGVDDDCDGGVDEDYPQERSTWYLDEDGDGWGRDGDQLRSCDQPGGYSAEPGDCDDRDGRVHPAAREPCNERDDDCDGQVDEGCPDSCGDGVTSGWFEECDAGDDLACPGLCSDLCACPALEPGDLQVHVVDVEQGDAVLVISPDGFVMLLDAGSSSACDSLDWYLEHLGVHEIDVTLVSHQHSDHLGSMDELLLLHPEVVACLDNGGSFSTWSDWDYYWMARPRRAGLVLGDSIDLGPAMSVEVLHSDQGAGNENENSVVLALTYGDFRMLLGGDCESGCERGLDAGIVAVYKVHHHGASDSSSSALLDRIEPRVGIISAGAGNPYGHPHSATLQRLQARGIELYRTDNDGDVVVVSDGTGFEINGTVYP